jgi:hypothetical protein
MAEGRVFSSGSGRTVSSLGTEVWGSNNFSQQLSKASHQERSLMESEGVEVAKGLSAASRDATDLLKRISQGDSSGKNYTLDTSSAESKSFGNVMRFTRNLQKTFGVNQQEAMQLALSASLAVSRRYDFNPPKKDGADGNEGKDEPAAKLYETSDSITIGANAQGGYSKEAGRKITFEDLKSFAKEQNYNESIESIQKAIEHQQYGNSSTKDKSLSSAASASLEKLRSHRDSYQLHHQKAERLSKGAQIMKSSSFDSRTNLTQAVLDFIADQPSIDGKSVLGLETARKMMDATSGPLADKREHYIKAFQEQRSLKAIQQFMAEHIKDPDSVKTEFEIQKAPF